MGTLGWPHSFRPQPWPDLAAEYAESAAGDPRLQHLADIVDSVIGRGASQQLAGCTSHYDLFVASLPIGTPADVIAVRAPIGGVRGVEPGHVLIEHLAQNGRNDIIQRPTTDAVRLFWRFIQEKYGYQPDDMGKKPHADR